MLQVQYHGAAIRSLESLSCALSCDLDVLKHVAEDISDYYTQFEVEKKGGGYREIRPPKPTLKAIQKRINSRILRLCAFPGYLQGSIKDSSNPRDFVSNANAHAGAKFVISADIRNFYPSVSEKNVKEVFKYLFRFSDDVSNLLVSLTMLEGSLPQGAPTSSYLANLVFYDCEHKLVAELKRKNLTYTRLIDDITISSAVVLDKSQQEWIVRKVRALTAKKGFDLHRGKLKLARTNMPGEQVFVTGLWIDKGRPRLSAESRGRIRAMVHHCKKQHEAGHRTAGDFHDLHNSTSGSVALMARLGHAQSGKYRSVLKECLPEYDKRYSRKLAKICYRFAAKKGRGGDTIAYARRYHQLMYHLAILGRSDKGKASFLRAMLKNYPPANKIAELTEE